MIALLLLLGCPAEDVDQEQETTAYEPLESAQLLRRLSLDLRGVLPTAEETAAVEADPDAVWTYRDAFLEDDRLRMRLVHMLGERWLTRFEEQEVSYVDYDLEDTQGYEYVTTFGEEPLQLMAEVAVSDEPWPTIVTADWMMANELMSEIWPVDRPEGDGWQRSTWTDGRPAAGVLVSTGLWWRYTSVGGNNHRGRVAAISRLLLCEDYLERPVSFSRTGGLDAEETEAAMFSDDACLGCHSSIEPMRVVFYGFTSLVQYNAHEADRYHPERERMGLLTEGIEPAYFGEPIEGLADLGVKVAADRRFYRCTAEQAAQSLWRRSTEDADEDTILELRDGFVDGGFLYKDLLAAVTETEAYQAGSLTGEASTDQQDYERTIRMLTPAQVQTVIEDLTGFVWSNEDGWDVFQADMHGYRQLAGGVDGIAVTSPQMDPGLTWALATERYMELAADYAVATELVDNQEGAGLFGELTLDDRPGDAAFTDALDAIWLRATSRELDADTRSSLESLWTDAEANADASEAWALVLSVILRDPLVVTY